jgi:prolyl-tRNA editing enzyme YbaK/EbsC (Cys-tRNA(Pro) deacylase)
MSEELPQRTRVVRSALVALGIEPHIRELSDSARTAAEAAAALGCEVGAIANSLVFWCDGAAMLIMTSGRHRVDLALVAGQIGAETIVRATPDQVRQATGQAIGGVSPLGHPAPLRSYVDAALAAYPVLWAAAGTPHTVFSTSYAELLSMTGGHAIAVAEEG